MKKKKIGIFITSEEYYRNFIKSNIVNDLARSFETHVFFPENLKIDKEKIRNCKSISKFQISKKENIHQYWNRINIWRQRSRAISFKARILEYFRIDFKRFNINETGFLKFLIFLKKILKFFYDIIQFLIFNIISYGFFYEFIKKFYISNLEINKSLINCLEKKNIDLIVNPTSAHNSISIDLLRISKTKKIKSLFIIDNWDNLSNKIYFDEKPNYILCWGQQSKIHARKIHDINRNIESIGSARFDQYFKKRKNKLKKIYKHKYILFLGASFKWNEKEALIILDNLIKKNKKKYKGIRIIYRPHPKVNWRIWFKQDEFQNILIDKQIKNTKYREWPDLDYYPKLLSNCLFVVGSLTSMLIESTIFYKRYLALSYNDNISLMNQSYVLKTRLHLKEINRLKNIYLCKDIKKLPKQFNFLFKNYYKTSSKYKAEIDKKRNFFLYHDNYSFTERLEYRISKILK